MNTPRKTAKNFTAVFLSEILGKLITFYAIVFYLAKYFSKEQFGAYNQVFVFISFGFLFATFGMDRIVVREIAKTPKLIGRITGSALLVKGILALTSFGLANLVLSLAGGVLNYSPKLLVLIHIASLGILLSVFSVFGAVLHYRLRLGQRSVATVAARLLAAGAMIALVALHAPLHWFVVAGLLLGVPGALLGVPEALLLYIFYRRGGKESLGINISTCAKLVKQAAPIALCDIFIITYARVDQIMLQGMLGKESLVGIYNFATRFAEVLRIIPLAFMASIFPSLCRAYEQKRASFEEAYRRSFKYMSLICIPVAFASILLSKPLILAVNGKYVAGAPILTILLFAEVFVFLGIVNNRLLVSSGRQTLDILFTGASAAINIVLNLLLIGRLGMAGAALASLVAYATGPILGLLIPFTRPFSMAMFRASLKPTGAASIMLLAIWLSADRLGLLASAALGAAVYLGAIALVRGLDREDATLIRSVFHKA